VETTQSILTNQPIVALTSISTIKTISVASTTSTVTDSIGIETAPSPSLPPQSIVQSGGTHGINSLVVSVPLASTSLSPHSQLINNPNSIAATTPILHPERVVNSPDRSTSNTVPPAMTGGNSNQGGSIITSEMSGGGLKITYEKQDAVTTEVDMELEVSPSSQDAASKRSHSVDKSEKGGRGKKRSSGANGIINQLNNTSISSSSAKRSSRSQNSTPPQQGAFSSITQSQLKDSPPSSPSSESQSAVPMSSGRGKSKTRKSAPSALARPHSPKDTKDIKLFQNGVTAPHMLGNQLNPNSNMAQKMSDHLNSELEAHSIFNPNDNSNIMGPQLHHRVIASARASSTGGSSTTSGSGLSSMLGGGGGNIPQTLDQLLERQWEQGSQFLMEQAQHFDSE
jgi:hypothetical protein